MLTTEHDPKLEAIDLAIDLTRQPFELAQHFVLAQLRAKLDVLLDLLERGSTFRTGSTAPLQTFNSPTSWRARS